MTGDACTVELPGIRGVTMLGFLAGLGVLATLDRRLPDRRVRLAWTTEGSHGAVVHLDRPMTGEQAVEEFVAAVHKATTAKEAASAASQHVPGWDPELAPKAPTKVEPDVYRALVAAATDDGSALAWLAALASDLAVKNGNVAITKLFCLSGNEDLDKKVGELEKELVKGGVATTREHFTGLLTGEVKYVDNVNSLGFDTTGVKRAALDGRDAKTRGVPALVWLGVQAWPLLPTFGASTVGMSAASPTRFIWPVWTHPLGLRSVRLLIDQALRVERDKDDALRVLRRWGVTELLAAPKRSRGGKGYRQFDPPAAIEPPSLVTGSGRSQDR